MDTRTGEIYDKKTVEEIISNHPELNNRFIPMQIPPTAKQLSRQVKSPFANQVMGKVARNEPCPCGSGKKFKKCCWFEAIKQHNEKVNKQ